MKKAAMLLSGCGNLDGSEIHEATLLLLTLKQHRYDVDFFSLDKEIPQSISHSTREMIAHKRNMMEMSGRIARGNIQNAKLLKCDDYHLLAMPGGFGAAKNFSDFGAKGAACLVDHEIARVIRDFYEAKKLIVAMCIAPMIVGKVLEGSGVKMTVGTEAKDLETLASMGIEAVPCGPEEACIDHKHHVYTVPAYMGPADPAKIYTSLQKLFAEL